MDMRNIFTAAAICVALALFATGCRQTTGTAPGAFSAIGPLSPVNGQTPVLGPFGGNTRVAPPSTGSFQAAPASAPITQPSAYGPLGANPSFSSPQNFASNQSSASNQNFASNQPGGFSNQPIGSGVQQATWTETLSNVPSAEQFGSTSIPTSSSSLRLGGMQVIDLTAAPNPPGYAPNGFAPQQFASPQVPANRYAPNPYPTQNFYPPTGAAAPLVPSPLVPSPTAQLPPPQAPVTFQAPAIAPPPSTNWSAPSTTWSASDDFVPDAGRIAASELKPLPPPTRSSAVPAPDASPQADLPWRRPGTRF